MSTGKDESNDRTDYGTTLIELARRADGTWAATQRGLDLVGTGASAARATEDLAGQIADRMERGEDLE